LKARNERYKAVLIAQKSATNPAYLIRRKALWGPGAIIKVAFRGGANALRSQIAGIADRWAHDKQHTANVAFDWGFDAATGAFREWTQNDALYAASIRVSFDNVGYWSQLGTDSIDPSVAKPGEASLNLQGFDQSLPSNWEGVVLHEFGHALGFEHEHQSPAGGCGSQFRFDDDESYTPTTDSYGEFIEDAQGRRPGIYRWLGGPPNNWPKSRVDDNMKELSNSSRIYVGPYDPKSIMEYSFPEWMCKTANNMCCVPENLNLSNGDIAGILRFYPMERKAQQAFLNEQSRVLKPLTDAKAVDIGDRIHTQELLEGLKASVQKLAW
jgi:hypothetical protein